MIEPRMRYEDYKKWMDEMDAITVAFRKGKITAAESQVRSASTIKKYAGKINDNDIRHFKDELGLRAFLRTLEPNPLKIEETISHEREHFETAQRLGMQADYGVARFYINVSGRKEIGYQAFVHTVSRKPSDITAVLAAPSHLSEPDKSMLR